MLAQPRGRWLDTNSGLGCRLHVPVRSPGESVRLGRGIGCSSMAPSRIRPGFAEGNPERGRVRVLLHCAPSTFDHGHEGVQPATRMARRCPRRNHNPEGGAITAPTLSVDPLTLMENLNSCTRCQLHLRGYVRRPLKWQAVATPRLFFADHRPFQTSYSSCHLSDVAPFMLSANLGKAVEEGSWTVHAAMHGFMS